jgi:hypothetical protein
MMGFMVGEILSFGRELYVDAEKVSGFGDLAMLLSPQNGLQQRSC